MSDVLICDEETLELLRQTLGDHMPMAVSVAPKVKHEEFEHPVGSPLRAELEPNTYITSHINGQTGERR